MYEFLEGTIAGRSPARLVLQAGGVGWDLAVPLGSDFHVDERGRAKAFTHLVVREDAHTLYGFPDRELRDLFRLLLSVRGVGPSMALGVLSGLTRDALLEAIVTGDAKALTRVKGVGQKTAQQILLDLHDKATSLSGAAPGGSGYVLPAPGAPPAERAAREDAVGALVAIGYSDKDARKNVDRAAEKVGVDDLEALVRTALLG
jgi:Holliday junction DNA helicase RuvA